jgi:sugar lactone lactonase YvrE
VSKDAGGTWTSLTDTAPYSGTTTGTIAITGATIAMNGYQYRCVATNVLRGATSDAAVLTVSKMAATVTLVGSLSATYDGNAHSAAAITSPAGLTVDFTYRGSAAAPVNAGSYAVVATISDPDYQGSASGILAIAKASLIATADDENRAQGMANPTLTITYTGFVNGETAAVLDTPPTASTTATANSPVGSYPIILSGGSDKNYVLMLQNGTLTVTFTPTANAGQGVISKGFTASWNSVSGVTGYKLDVSTSSAFSSFVGGYQNFDVGNSTSEVIAGLGSNTTYYYRVRAYNSDGTGPASNIVTVTTAAPAVVMTPLAFSTLAGQALCSGSADGVGSAARFDYPSAVAADNAGNLYVADTDNHTVRKIVISTGAVTTLAGAAGSPGNADGTGPAAHFNNPSGVAVDGAGNVYIADTLNHTLRKVTSAGVVSTLAGLSGSAGFADGAGSAARFSGPQGLAIDGSGRLYVADTNNDSIRQVEISTGSVTTIPCRPFTLAVAAYCRNKAPTGVAVVGTGNIYVADPYDQRINGINPSGFFFVLAGEVTFYAAPAGADDGAGAVASFNSPSAIAEDLSGNLYVADTDNHTIRRIVTTGYSGDTFANWDDGVVTTSAGVAGTSGSADGLGSAARFFGPAGIAVDNNGDVFVADTNNHTIREFLQGTAPVIQTQPQSQTVTTGSSVQFFVTASGSPAATYQWNLNGAAISGATGGTYSLSSAQSGNAGNYTVVVSNVIGSVTSSAATLTVNVTSGGGGSGGSSSGGGGGGGAPSTWFCGALLLIAAIRTLQQRRERQKAWGFHVS